MFMDPKNLKKGNKVCETISGHEGLQDILQLLKEQSEKMKRLGLALKVVQNGMQARKERGLKAQQGKTKTPKRVQRNPTG